MRSFNISQIWIYPIKSLPGIRLKEAVLTDRGIALDRRWMLTDSSGRFISQRQYPQLSQFVVTLTDNEFQISTKDNLTNICKIPLYPQNGKTRIVTVWDDQVEALNPSEAIDEWFSQVLGFEVYLVYMPDETKRLVNPKYAQNDEIVSFADGYPLMLIGQSSLDDLNSRLLEKVEMRRFRPNLVVEGALPFEEDQWQQLLINENVQLIHAKPCARCVMVNIDPDSGHKSNEVLKTLSTYRRVQEKVMFGQHWFIRQPGVIKENDQVLITITKEIK
jgi:uncharacterized protein YcbX